MQNKYISIANSKGGGGINEIIKKIFLIGMRI